MKKLKILMVGIVLLIPLVVFLIRKDAILSPWLVRDVGIAKKINGKYDFPRLKECSCMSMWTVTLDWSSEPNFGFIKVHSTSEIQGILDQGYKVMEDFMWLDLGPNSLPVYLGKDEFYYPQSELFSAKTPKGLFFIVVDLKAKRTIGKG